MIATIIILTWLILGLIGGLIHPLPHNRKDEKKGVAWFIIHLVLGVFSVISALGIRHLINKTRKEDRILHILTIVSTSFDEEVHAEVGSYFGSPSAHIEGKKDMMVRIREKLEQELK